MKFTGEKRVLAERVISAIFSLKDDVMYSVEIKENRKKRTLTANSYYWALLYKYAEFGKVSVAQLHNEMLANYGQEMILDDRRVFAVIPDTDEYLKSSTVHLKATSQVKIGKDGKAWRTMVLLRGSHEYDSKEMARLIDGLIQEIKGSHAPIETMTEKELALLKGYRN